LLLGIAAHIEEGQNHDGGNRNAGRRGAGLRLHRGHPPFEDLPADRLGLGRWGDIELLAQQRFAALILLQGSGQIAAAGELGHERPMRGLARRVEGQQPPQRGDPLLAFLPLPQAFQGRAEQLGEMAAAVGDPFLIAGIADGELLQEGPGIAADGGLEIAEGARDGKLLEAEDVNHDLARGQPDQILLQLDRCRMHLAQILFQR